MKICFEDTTTYNYLWTISVVFLIYLHLSKEVSK